MQLQSILFPLLLATSVAANGDDGFPGPDGSKPKGMSGYGMPGPGMPDQQNLPEKLKCMEMKSLERFVALAANTTKLEKFTKNNATAAADLQAQAAEASKQLTSLKSNTTLVADCAANAAAAEEEEQCQKMWELQGLVAFAANTTALADKTHNNATRVATIQAKASAAGDKLQSLTSNTTLQAACPAIKQKKECEGMQMLEGFVAMSKNQTLLDEITKKDATKIERIKAEAAEAQTKLTELQKNTTFTSECSKLGLTGEKGGSGKGINSGSATEAGTTKGKQSAAAAAAQGGSVHFTMLSAILVVAAGMSFL